MKVASFNVNSIRARLPVLLDWLKKESPDVLCIQETKVTDTDFPRTVFEDIQYSVAFRGEKSYNGVAILSKSPPDTITFGFDDSESEGTRLITATIHSVPVLNTYIPQGLDPLSDRFRYKLDWFQRLYDYIDRNFTPDTPLLWMGDFNVAPGPADVYDPEKMAGQIGYHPDEHGALQRIIDWGFVDVFRMHQTDSAHYTFWDYRIPNAVKRKIGWRIDHICATRPLAEKSTGSWIDMEPRLKRRPSDHTPILAEFEI